MKIRHLWRVLALLLCVVAAVATGLPSTVAYIADRTNTIHNIFRVEYLPPQDISVPVRVHKTVLSMSDEEISPAGFVFHLMNKDTGVITEMTSLSDGWATVNLPFTAEDVGKNFCYHLYELNDGQKYIIYDDSVYDICITLKLDAHHEIVAEFTLNGESTTEIVAEFENICDYYDIPNTGDHAWPLLWTALLLLSSMGLVLLYRKECIFRRP
ncbi:MAG: LPXTG cell wall anchor domain-containing protein [Clostridiales bacterium]|nr:LPXTG cell wall anchor domain-containing protein [Clostridiales bacterium]